jgi:hypothetical protein
MPAFTSTLTLPRRGGGDPVEPSAQDCAEQYWARVQMTLHQVHELARARDARGGNFLLAACRDLPV